MIDLKNILNIVPVMGLNRVQLKMGMPRFEDDEIIPGILDAIDKAETTPDRRTTSLPPSRVAKPYVHEIGQRLDLSQLKLIITKVNSTGCRCMMSRVDILGLALELVTRKAQSCPTPEKTSSRSSRSC